MKHPRPRVHPLPVLALGALAALGCRSPEGADAKAVDPVAAGKATEASAGAGDAVPMEATVRVSNPSEPTPLPGQEMTDAEAERNERFGDRRRKRYTPN